MRVLSVYYRSGIGVLLYYYLSDIGLIYQRTEGVTVIFKGVGNSELLKPEKFQKHPLMVLIFRFWNIISEIMFR